MRIADRVDLDETRSTLFANLYVLVYRIEGVKG